MPGRKKQKIELRYYDIPQREGVLFCSIPTMVVFFILQKQFAEGITGSVK